MGVVILVTVIGILGSVIGVAEDGWTAESQRAIVGMATFVALMWALYWATIRLLWRTVPRDTSRRLREIPD
jgi:O-antigen/teichoic acid export membrane protein